ncbi:hypothetical protein ACTID9_01220 [Brevibacillus fluminis]
MNHLISLLIITAFVCTLCFSFWSTDVETQMAAGQEIRIKKATALIFH